MGKKAVLVGCNYPGTKAELHGCINDVWRMHRTLVDRFGFDEQDITVLIDTDRKYTQPTGANIRRALNKLVTESEPGDVLFFHYSGHGTRLPAETGDDDDTGYEECIVPCDMNLLNDDDFREIVDKVPQGVILTIVSDSCHSGGLIDGSKEQIGESSVSGESGESGGSRDFGLGDFVAQGVHEAFESRGVHLPSFGFGHGHGHHGHHKDNQRYQQVDYSGSGHVKSRSLPLSTLLEILRQKTGKDDIDVGNIRPALFDMFGEDSSSRVKTFVKVLVQGMHKGEGDESGGGLMGMVGSLAQQFLTQKLDETDDSSEYVKPALQTPVGNKKMAYAGAKVTNSQVARDMGVLLSGCQSSETSADANPTGNPDHAYGAMSNAIQTILSEHGGPVTNRELIARARQILGKQGFTQHPGLYCSDQNAESPFIC